MKGKMLVRAYQSVRSSMDYEKNVLVALPAIFRRPIEWCKTFKHPFANAQSSIFTTRCSIFELLFVLFAQSMQIVGAPV